jgi:hypothetical protein
MDIRLVKAVVIGDGCLGIKHHTRNINARLTITHSVKQKDYLLWKKDLLEAGGLPTWYSEFINTVNPHTGKKGLMCRVESGANPVLTVLRGQMYPKENGFCQGVLDDLEAIHLAIIFMDDGCKQVNKTVRIGYRLKKSYPCHPYIASYQLSLQSHGFSGANQFVDWLDAKFGIHAAVWRQKGQAKVAVYRNKDKELFRQVVSPHIHSSLAYKLDGQFNAHVIHRERLSERTPNGDEMSNGAVRQSELAGIEPREGEPKSLPAGESRS